MADSGYSGQLDAGKWLRPKDLVEQGSSAGLRHAVVSDFATRSMQRFLGIPSLMEQGDSSGVLGHAVP